MLQKRLLITRLAGTTIAVSIVLAIFFSSISCQSNTPEKIETITLGTTTSEVNTLIFIAREKGYFADNGLSVNIKIYPSGVAAINGMLKQEVDMAAGSEFAFAGNVLAGDDVRLIGNINRSSVEYLVSRTDRGISKLADLKGKKIGVPLKSRPEFALSRFLYLNGLAASDMTLVNVSVDQSANALVNGEVDAVATWQPYIDRIKEQIGDDIVTWSVQNNQPSYNVLISTEDRTTGNRDLIVRTLKSLVQAEKYNLSNPEEVKAIIKKQANYTDEYVTSVWQDYQFSVSLDQSLVTAMEDEARWMIENKLTEEKVVPDFLKYIYVEGLKAVKPEAVDIIK